MSKWKLYLKTATTGMRPYEPGEDLSKVSVDVDYMPKLGDMLATDGKTTWLIQQDYFRQNYTPVADELAEGET